MDPLYISFLLNGLLGVAMFFMKTNHDLTKEHIGSLRSDVEILKSSAVRKEDFKEFKEELWRRLDTMESHIRTLQKNA